DARAVFLTQSETSTGVVADIQGLAAAARPSGAHVVVDAVSSLGAVPLEVDAWGIDVACAGSQKALMTPPGLAMASVSDAVWAPDGIDATELVAQLRDCHGVQLANGQAHLKGQIFRIGHIGYYDVFDIATALGAVELGLADLGADIERGVAVTRALDVYAE